jgi:hypothetical protein
MCCTRSTFQALLDMSDLLLHVETRRTRPQVVLPERLSEEVRRLLDWHWSQLEYGCSAPLSKVTVPPAAALLALRVRICRQLRAL